LKIYILQGRVATQLRHDKIFNNQFIANCPQSVPDVCINHKISKLIEILSDLH